MAKQKLKTHKKTAKVFKVRPGGTIKRGIAGFNHMTGKKNASYNRRARKGSTLSHADKKRLREQLH